ncbi:unnamed protein product [Fusarium venenatum]|uniref:Uncharacterized protein n=1 Tax=Fusarium venenatum TaxID=56646 RepID=A0A2L2TF65_9HYPO|nr:uncharacterized protein FVRRES_00573 [Fusarium venenatum]CEI64061.1 unnamed protein product [Fusarium venenatum]
MDTVRLLLHSRDCLLVNTARGILDTAAVILMLLLCNENESDDSCNSCNVPRPLVLRNLADQSVKTARSVKRNLEATICVVLSRRHRVRALCFTMGVSGFEPGLPQGEASRGYLRAVIRVMPGAAKHGK